MQHAVGLDEAYLTGAHLNRGVPPISHMDLAEWLADPERSQAYINWNINVAASGPRQGQLRQALRREDLEQAGLYQLLRAAGSEPRMATEQIGARAATPAEARTLQEKRGAPLLTMSRTAWDGAGRVVEHGDHVYRAGHYSFEIHLSVG